MSKKLFVGNLPFDVNDADLATVLAVAGTVVEAKIIINKKTGRSKGYGFVEMETEAMAQDAISKFEGATLNERSLTVQLATPKQVADAKTETAAEISAETNSEASAGEAAGTVVESAAADTTESASPTA
jgi:RNA recognition motif-containing protein